MESVDGLELSDAEVGPMDLTPPVSQDAGNRLCRDDGHRPAHTLAISADTSATCSSVRPVVSPSSSSPTSTMGPAM